jgi:hypothetical protein
MLSFLRSLIIIILALSRCSYTMTILIIALLLATVPAHAAELTGTASGVQGPIDSRSVEIGASDQFGDAAWRASYTLNEVAGVLAADVRRVSAGYDPELAPLVHAWIFGMWTDNRVTARVESETGGGLKLYLTKSDRTKVSLSLGLISHTVRDESEVLRVSYRLKGSKGPVKGVIFYQPAIQDGGYVVRGSMSLDHGTDERGVRMSVSYERDSEAPELETLTPAITLYYELKG